MSFGGFHGLPVYRAPRGPSLALNFLDGQPDPRITFTRSTTATYIGSDGLIQTAVVNRPRFDYNPVTLAPLGLLLEEERMNVLLNSATLSTQAVVVTAVPYTLSFYGTGTIVLSGAYAGIDVGAGAYPARKVITFTPTAGALVLTVTGSVQFAQLEAGAFATSYIPTTSVAVTRADDNASMTGTNFSDWFNPAEGTLMAQFDVFSTSTSTAEMTIVSADDGDADGYSLNKEANSAKFIGRVGADASILGTEVANVFSKAALAYNGVSNAGSLNGAAAVEITSMGSEVSAPLILWIGRSITSRYLLSGHVKAINYYPRRMTNAELQAITS